MFTAFPTPRITSTPSRASGGGKKYTAHIMCRCPWRTERAVDSRLEAEVIGNEHVAQSYKRPYQHDVEVVLTEA